MWGVGSCLGCIGSLANRDSNLNPDPNPYLRVRRTSWKLSSYGFCFVAKPHLPGSAHTAVGFGGRTCTCTCTCTCTYRWGPKGYRRDGALVHGVVHALVDNLLVESLELLGRLPPRKELDLGVLGIVLRREVGRRRVASHLLGGLA